MKDFTANFVSMFIADKKRRHMVRRKIKHWNELILPADAQKMIAAATAQNLERARKEYDLSKLREAAAKNHDLARQYIEVKKQWRRRCGGAAPLPGRFAEYDLVFAIGATCHVSSLLAFHKLRTFSSPLEWTAGTEPEFWYSKPNIWRDSRFKEKINALCNDFKDWFNPGDLRPVSHWMAKEAHQGIINTKTNIRWMHLFSNKESFELQIDKIRQKMQMRSDRLLKAIAESERVLVCWVATVGDQCCLLEAPVSDKDIKDALKKLHKKWPGKEFDFVFFEHDGRKNIYEFDRIEVAPSAYRVRSNHFFNENAYRFVASYLEHIWPEPVMAEMLDNVSLTDKLADFMKAEQG